MVEELGGGACEAAGRACDENSLGHGFSFVLITPIYEETASSALASDANRISDRAKGTSEGGNSVG